MKSSLPESVGNGAAFDMQSTSRFRPLGKIRNFLRRFRADLRTPLPDAEGKPFGRRVRLRFRFLYRQYGWKLVAGVIAYYLIRDTLLYLILPYLIAQKLID